MVPTMRTRFLGIVAAVLALGGAGALAWTKLRPEPPPPLPPVERGIDTIPVDEYEKWMQDLDYTK